jgi:hypothetical protein
MSTADLFGKLYEDFFVFDTIDKFSYEFLRHSGVQSQSKHN